VLTGREHNLADGYHALFSYGFPDQGECLLADLAIWRDVVGAVQVEFVDLVLGHELIDIDYALALDRDGFEFLGIKLDVIALADLVALAVFFDQPLDVVTALALAMSALDAQYVELTLECGRIRGRFGPGGKPPV
jgi:hypothetical protein